MIESEPYLIRKRKHSVGFPSQENIPVRYHYAEKSLATVPASRALPEPREVDRSSKAPAGVERLLSGYHEDTPLGFREAGRSRVEPNPFRGRQTPRA